MKHHKGMTQAARELGFLEGQLEAYGDIIEHGPPAAATWANERHATVCDEMAVFVAAQATAEQAAQDAEIKAERDAALDEQEPVDVDRPANPITGNRSVSEGWQG